MVQRNTKGKYYERQNFDVCPKHKLLTATLTHLQQQQNQTKQKILFTKVLDEQSLLASDLTGRFPVMSSRGHNYIFVAYHYDTNYIAVRPLKNRSAAEL